MYKERDSHNSQHTQFIQVGPFPDVKNDVLVPYYRTAMMMMVLLDMMIYGLLIMIMMISENYDGNDDDDGDIRPVPARPRPQSRTNRFRLEIFISILHDW